MHEVDERDKWVYPKIDCITNKTIIISYCETYKYLSVPRNAMGKLTLCGNYNLCGPDCQK